MQIWLPAFYRSSSLDKLNETYSIVIRPVPTDRLPKEPTISSEYGYTKLHAQSVEATVVTFWSDSQGPAISDSQWTTTDHFWFQKVTGYGARDDGSDDARCLGRMTDGHWVITKTRWYEILVRQDATVAVQPVKFFEEI